MNADILDEAAAWLLPCGRCDADLATCCGCPSTDPRVIIAALVAEVRTLRAGVLRGDL